MRAWSTGRSSVPIIGSWEGEQGKICVCIHQGGNSRGRNVMDSLRLKQEPLQKVEAVTFPLLSPWLLTRHPKIPILGGGRSPARPGQSKWGHTEPSPAQLPPLGLNTTQIHLILLPKPFWRAKTSANFSLKQLLPRFSSCQSTELNHQSLG